MGRTVGVIHATVAPRACVPDEKASGLRLGTMSVAMADLDHVTNLNDTYGHQTGDRALGLFSRVLTDSVRAQDLTCRQGGEEFVVALPECGAAATRSVLDAVRERLAAGVQVSALPASTASVGVVEANEDLPTLIARADDGLDFSAFENGAGTRPEDA